HTRLQGDWSSDVCSSDLVTAAARGQGVGRKIAESLFAEARAKGARKLYLESNRKLDRALALYRSLGFKELPHVENSRYASCDIKIGRASCRERGAIAEAA